MFLILRYIKILTKFISRFFIHDFPVSIYCAFLSSIACCFVFFSVRLEKPRDRVAKDEISFFFGDSAPRLFESRNSCRAALRQSRGRVARLLCNSRGVLCNSRGVLCNSRGVFCDSRGVFCDSRGVLCV